MVESNTTRMSTHVPENPKGGGRAAARLAPTPPLRECLVCKSKGSGRR